MAGTFTPTGAYSNLTRLELEQLRRGDYAAGGKALTIGDSGLAPEGVVGPGNVNAEAFYTNASITLSEVNSISPPPQPGRMLGKSTDLFSGGDAGSWIGPTSVAFNIGTASTTDAVSLSDTGALFITGDIGSGTIPVQVGDLLLIELGGTDNFAVGRVSVVNSETSISCDNIVGASAVGGTNFTPQAVAMYEVIRPAAAQLFAIPGSGPLGQEQTFLFFNPESTLHTNTGPTTDDINTDRIRDIIVPKYALDSSVDRSDAIYQAPAPHASLSSLGYRVVFYPDNGTGTGPDLSSPITALNPVIDPAIPAGDQRVTIDYAAGTVRFSCAPAIGGQIKVAGGVNGTTGRLNLYAVFWTLDTGDRSNLTSNTSRALYQSLATESAYFPPARLSFGGNRWIFNGFSVEGGGNEATNLNVSGTTPAADVDLHTHGVRAPFTTSLVQKANAQTFTVGDGTISWGDFSGSNALVTAINTWTTAGTSNSLTIFVKPGSYSLGNSQFNIPTGKEVTLCGSGREATVITADAGSYVATAIGIGTGARLHLSDLAVVWGTGGYISVQGGFSADRCLFERVSVQYSNAVPLKSGTSGPTPIVSVFNDCEFNYEDADLVTKHAIMIYANGVDMNGFHFRGCSMRSAKIGGSFLQVKTFGVGSTACTVSHVDFDTCLIEVNAVQTLDTTRLNSDGGVITADPDGTFNVLTLSQVRIHNCTVLGLNTFVTPNFRENAVLLHLMPLAYDATDLTKSIIINTVEISGGSWTAPNNRGSDFVGFFLMCHRPIVRDVIFTGGGQPTQSLGTSPGFRGNGLHTTAQKLALRVASNDVISSGTSWATIAATGGALQGPGVRSVSGMVVQNIIFKHFHRLAGPSGAITLYGPDIEGGPADVNGVHVIDPVAGSAGNSNIVLTWFHLIPGGLVNTNRGTNGKFQNLTFSSGNTAAVLSHWVSAAYISIAAEGQLVLEGASINPGNEGSTEPAGGSGIQSSVYWDNAAQTTCPAGPLSIIRCSSNNIVTPLFVSNVSGTGASGRIYAGPITIDRCTHRVVSGFTNVFGSGFVIIISGLPRTISISNCDFEATGIGSTSNVFGIWIDCIGTFARNYPVSILNNRLRFDFGAGVPGAGAYLINIESDNGFTGSILKGIVHGNNLSHGGNSLVYYGDGLIRVQTGNGSAIAGPFPELKGVETSISTNASVTNSGPSMFNPGATIRTP